MVLWIDDREGSKELTLALVDPDGAVVTGPVTVAQGHEPDRARIVCTGFDYGVVWLEGGALSLISLDEALEPRAPEVTFADDDPVSEFNLVWRGQDYVVATVEDSATAPGSPRVVLRTVACGSE